jgi:flavorubredoxin
LNETRIPGGVIAYSGILELSAGRVYALQSAFELDGRVSAYPQSARGYSVGNCYLLKEGDRALLLDTGYAVYEQDILDQLASLIEPDTPLSLFPLRINEFMSVSNAMAIAKRFNVVECFSNVPDIEDWIEFETLRGEQRNPVLKTTIIGRGDYSRLELNPGRFVDVLNAPIRLISTRWIYDEASKTLFSSDMFSHLWGDREDGPWLLGGNEDDAVTDFAFVRSFLLNTRYWWIEGANLAPIRRAVADVYDRFDIETIAPGYGTILSGREHVDQQFAVLDDVLGQLDRTNVAPAYVPRGLER